jgi:hypothetical protein
LITIIACGCAKSKTPPPPRLPTAVSVRPVMTSGVTDTSPTTVTASFMLQVSTDGESSQMTMATFASLLGTTPILQPAVEDAGLKMDDWRRIGTLEPRNISASILSVTITLKSSDRNAAATAEKVLRNVCDRATDALLASWDRQNAALQARLEPLNKNAETAKAKFEEARKTAAELQEKLDASSSDRNRSTRETLMNELRETQQTLAADRARLASLKQMPPFKPVDEVVGPLAKDAFAKAEALVEHRRKRVEMLKERAKTGKATEEEIEEAEFAAADARIFSLAYAATITGMTTLTGYIQQQPNDPRPELAANVAANDAKLKVLDEQILRLPRPQPTTSRAHLERANTAMIEARNELEATQQQIDQLRAHNRLGVRPQVTILGKEAKGQ